MSDKSAPTLTDARGLGGIIAQDGFDYQVWDALIRLPGWLRTPAFEGLMIEGLEDIEARYFTPYAPHGHVLDRFQAKSGALGKSDMVSVLENFMAFESAHPGVARTYTLVTPALPASLNWVARDTDRVRRARPFYNPFGDLHGVSEGALRNDLTREFGQELGEFFFEKVDVSILSLPSRDNAEAAFGASLGRAFPEFDISARRANTTFEALNNLASKSRGSFITREQILKVVNEGIQREIAATDTLLEVHIRSDRNEEASEKALEIDASSFSGGRKEFSQPENWRKRLLAPLDTTAVWARQNAIQKIALSGSYRLSTAFAVGRAFRSAIGFEIEIPTRSGNWSTDQHSMADSNLPWVVGQPLASYAGRLIVCIGILRDPVPAVRQHFQLADETQLLKLMLNAPLSNGTQAQASIQVIKNAVQNALNRLQATEISLYFVGPAALAVALGHRWNAFPPTQLHEFDATSGIYTPTLLVQT